jgi:hypothetical protein
MPAAWMIGHHFVGLGFLEGGERLWGLLLAWKNLLRQIVEPRADRGVGQSFHGGRIEPGDDLVRGAQNPNQTDK